MADHGREFAWGVNGSYARWGYTFESADGGGTKVTESWAFLPDGVAFFRERFGHDADNRIASAERAAHDGIPATLAALKRAAESVQE